MNFDLIIIGNELLNGKIQDLNTFFLSKELFKRGYTLRKVHIIGDNESEFQEALEAAKKHVKYIITTGGLGPTEDDLTKNFLVNFFHKKSEFNQKAFEITQKHYVRGGRKYNKEKVNYHNLPLDFDPIYNPVGYAPGIHLKEDGIELFATPGVPAEFQAMFTQEIFGKLLTDNNSFEKHLTIKTWKVSEANIFHKLCPDLWKNLKTYGNVSSLPHPLGVNIGVHLKANNQVGLDQLSTGVIEMVKKSELRDNIWHIGNESLEEVIIQKALAKKITFGFAESCTGGLLASRITDISGCSSVFWGSIVSYANEVKVNCLQVNEETLKEHGAVSIQTAGEMAEGARKNLGVDIAITTTGIAGPGGATPGKPVGTVGIGVATHNGSKANVYQFRGNRTHLKQIFSEAALMTLLEEIEKL